MTKTATPQAPTLRNVRAALRAADVRLYERPRTQRTHDGQIVQSIGWYGVKTEQWDDSTVRLMNLVSNPRYTEREVAKIVAALSGFTCQIDRRYGLNLFVTVGR